MNLIGIYKITSPSKRVYIGQSVNILKRWSEYKRKNCKNQLLLFNSFNKYGPDKHKFEILDICDVPELNIKEKYYILLFQCYDSKYGLNLVEGGRSSAKLSQEQRNKISQSLKGHKCSPETREKLRLANIGKKISEERRIKMRGPRSRPYNSYIDRKGRGISIEIRKKISDTLKGHPVSEETRQKLRLANLGKKHSEETKLKCSQLLFGNKRMLGKKLSQETLARMRISKKIRRDSVK